MGAFLRTAVAMILGIVIGAGALVAVVPRFATPAPAGTPPAAFPFAPAAPPNQGVQANPNPDAVSSVYERVSAAVVNITPSAQARDIFGRPVSQELGTGSGFIIDNEGHVVTNQHVVSGAARLDITLADGSSFVGNVVAIDGANDLALVKLQAPAERLSTLPMIPVGDSSQLKVGQTVVAIGNPFGLERSASVGIVSSLGRTRPGVDQRLITNMIQTDAAINPGNSGGPLLNLSGEVVGINEQIEGNIRGNIGIGFAIPSNTLKRYLPELKTGKEPKHAWFGIAGAPLTASAAEQLKSPVQQGVILAATATGGPAARAGLRGAGRSDPASADIITELDGQPVRSVEDIAAYIDRKEPGETVRVNYLRGGQAQTADVQLGVWEPRDTISR